MKNWPAFALAFLFAAPSSFAIAQDEEDKLTPAQMMDLLEDAHRLMGKAEALLNDSSRGGAESLQQGILERIGKLVEKAEKKEKDAADKLGEIIKKAKSSSGQSQDSQQKQQQQGKQSGKTRQPGNPARDTYDPNRADSPSKFKSHAVNSGAWGRLPPAARAALLAASKEEVPPEFQELWKRYYESLEKSDK